MGKGHILSTVPADVIAISETHLTAVSRQSFFRSLKSTGVGFSHLVSGAPMSPRSIVSEAGEWAGVAVASISSPAEPYLHLGHLTFSNQDASCFVPHTSLTFG